MPIAASELLFALSGGAGNSNVNLSIGGSKSTTTISDGTLNNLFDDVSAAEASTGDQEYRGIFLYNSNATLTLYSARVWISASTTAAGDEIYIATDTAGINNNNSMSSISDEGTAPTGVSWVAYGSTISLGDMAATKSYGIWIKRSVSAGAASQANNSASIAWDGETA